MIISEKNRKEICKYLFKEGVCYAKKDYNLAEHPEMDVPNLQVIKLMQSFKSREYVRETFAWMHYYWFLTNDGIEYLRTSLRNCASYLKESSKPVVVLIGLKEVLQGLVTVMDIVEVLEDLLVNSTVTTEELRWTTTHHLGQGPRTRPGFGRGGGGFGPTPGTNFV